MPDSPFSSPPRPAPDSLIADVAPLIRSVLRRWRVLLAVPLASAVIAAGVSLIIPKKFTSTTSFVAQSPNLPTSPLAGLASQFGVGLGSQSSSPQFYSDLLESQHLLNTVLGMRIVDPRTGAGPDSVTVLDLLIKPGKEPARRLQLGEAELRSTAARAVNLKTGVVKLSITTGWPTASAEIGRLFLKALGDFNVNIRQSQARERRRFAEARMREGQDSLRRAEDAMRSFLERNLSANAPSLRFQSDRLDRQIRQYHDLVTTLRRDYESARLDEVNDTPVLTVIDPPVVPTQRSSPRRSLIVVTAALFAGALTLLYVLATAPRSERAAATG